MTLGWLTPRWISSGPRTASEASRRPHENATRPAPRAAGSPKDSTLSARQDLAIPEVRPLEAGAGLRLPRLGTLDRQAITDGSGSPAFYTAAQLGLAATNWLGPAIHECKQHGLPYQSDVTFRWAVRVEPTFAEFGGSPKLTVDQGAPVSPALAECLERELGKHQGERMVPRRRKEFIRHQGEVLLRRRLGSCTGCAHQMGPRPTTEPK
jgi:hypothetical protein